MAALDDVVKNRHQQVGQGNRRRKSEECQQNRFPKELPNQLKALCAHDLANPYFLKASGSQGCCQVDIVETGDKKDDKAHCKENIDVADIADRAVMEYDVR